MEPQTTVVEFGSQKVEVPRGGYYDRFRMNPDLDEVAKDPAAGNIDFFRTISKLLVSSRVGRVWSPNFFYRTSSVQLILLAPLQRLRAALPTPLAPLQVLPGYGMAALTFFSYRVCDNDPYNEVSIAVVIRRPGDRKPAPLQLLQSVRRRSYFVHILALPVTTEIARVRGVYGYQLPKWLTNIRVEVDSGIHAQIDSTDGRPDVVVDAPLPRLHQAPSQTRMGTNTNVHLVDGTWNQTTVQSNTLLFAETFLPRKVELVRHDGPLSQLLHSLGASTIVRMDVVKDAQLVLNMPTPVDALKAS